MKVKTDWPRYILASVAVAFKSAASWPTLVEGVDERTETFMANVNRVEVRITGPVIQELSRDYYRLLVDVNTLLLSRGGNPYDIAREAGSFAIREIPILNYGNQPGDYDPEDPETQQHLGCLRLRAGVQIEHHGQIDTVAKIRASEVLGKYVVEITDE